LQDFELDAACPALSGADRAHIAGLRHARWNHVIRLGGGGSGALPAITSMAATLSPMHKHQLRHDSLLLNSGARKSSASKDGY
jgi:hypothetical protein